MKNKKLIYQQGGQLGSTLGSAAGMALGSIIAPGVGTAIGGMLGGKIGQGVSNFVNNEFEMGGKLTEYNGNQHENGGIPIGSKEVEGGETNHQGYIFSDTLKLGKNTFADMSKKINNKYSKRPDDKISKESKERELGNLAKIQESTGMTNQGNKFELGGFSLGYDTPKQVPGAFNYTLPSTDLTSSKFIAETKGANNYNPTPTSVPNTSVVPLVANGNTPLQTEVNPLGYLASNIGPAFDIIQGLKGGDEVNFDRVKQTYANPNPAITAMDNTTSTSFNNARNAIRNNATSSGEYLAMMNNLSGSESLKRGLGKAQIKSEYDKINSGTANQISAQNAGIQMQEATARQAETDASRSAVSQGLHNFGQNSLGFGQDKAMNKTQNTMLPMISDTYEYVEDADGNIITRRKKRTGNSNYKLTPEPGKP